MPVVAKRRSRLKGGDPWSGALREESHFQYLTNPMIIYDKFKMQLAGNAYKAGCEPSQIPGDDGHGGGDLIG